jgi:hypothetical protein
MDSWLKLMAPVQYRINARPVFMLFTFVLSPEHLREWKEKFPEEQRPIIVTFGADPKYKGIVDGRFGWTGNQPNRTTKPPYVVYVDEDRMHANELHDRQRASQLLDSGQLSFYIAGVSPGFDDVGVWGWGNGPRKVERNDGRTYQYRWDQILKTDLPNVFIATWNDWAEGTTIEPSVEYGNQYLSMTRDDVAKFKRVPAPAGDLSTPLWIYKVRKSTGDKMAIDDASRASQLIVEGNYAAAEALIKPWAVKLHLADLQLWEPPAQTH